VSGSGVTSALVLLLYEVAVVSYICVVVSSMGESAPSLASRAVFVTLVLLVALIALLLLLVLAVSAPVLCSCLCLYRLNVVSQHAFAERSRHTYSRAIFSMAFLRI
jgi:hypothetical protein